MEVYQVTLGQTPMIGKTAEEALVCLAMALPGMKTDHPFPITIKKIEVTQEWYDRLCAATPWANWDKDEERTKEEAARKLLEVV